MDPDLGLTTALLVAGLLLTEFGAAGGAALATLPRHRRPGGERPVPTAVLEWAAYHRTRLEPTLLVVQTTGLVVLTTTLGHNLFEAQGPSGEMALLTALTAIVLTAFTQVSAWGLATRRPERVLRALALPMRLALWAATPVIDRKSTRLNSSHTDISRMPSSA